MCLRVSLMRYIHHFRQSSFSASHWEKQLHCTEISIIYSLEKNRICSHSTRQKYSPPPPHTHTRLNFHITAWNRDFPFDFNTSNIWRWETYFRATQRVNVCLPHKYSHTTPTPPHPTPLPFPQADTMFWCDPSCRFSGAWYFISVRSDGDRMHSS